MNEEILPLIQYRLKQADDSIKDATVLLKENMTFRSVTNRLYYAMFYTVLALLQERQIGTSKHAGAISLFDKEFIKSGIFDVVGQFVFAETTLIARDHSLIVALSIPIPGWGSALLAPAGADPCSVPINNLPLPIQYN